MKYSIVACVLATCVTAANAQLYSFPAPPMTVADCQGGRIWMKRNGLATCDFFVPDPPPPPPPPPPPAPTCQYFPQRFAIYIGDMGQCSADGGCQGTGYMIYYGGAIVATEMWVDTWLWPDLNARASAAIATTGYSLGKFLGADPGNGNNMGMGIYEVCR
ncbi:hypothetical protein E0W60_35650 (plasmid) [Cupriavidus oxalaticus]|uniref:Uncharacterized protein n=1 Tax=Cupriavidus oxalaticus TaxID=96344 RepID=A0A4P7LJM5_9BURK|nr:hypothetical protein E0W60_35650 [Cupriavidus oxalaticus]